MPSIERDGEAVAAAFAEAHPLPSPGDVESWVSTHPQHGELIRRRARELVESTLEEIVRDAAEASVFRARARQIFAESGLGDVAKSAASETTSSDNREREQQAMQHAPGRPATTRRRSSYDA